MQTSATASNPLGVSLLQQGMKGLMGKDIKLLVSIRTLCMYVRPAAFLHPTMPISLTTSLKVRWASFPPTTLMSHVQPGESTGSYGPMVKPHCHAALSLSSVEQVSLGGVFWLFLRFFLRFFPLHGSFWCERRGSSRPPAPSSRVLSVNR